MRCNRWINSSSIKQKKKKRKKKTNKELLVQKLGKLLMIILKSRCHSKIIQFFNDDLNELFP